jgi:hypothetical protein
METKLTIIENLDGPLSKSLTLSEGRLQKAAAADLTRGLATQAAVHSIGELAAVVSGLTSHQALTFGVTAEAKAKIATQKAIENGRPPSGAVSRDRANFAWPDGPGVLMLDIDQPKDGSKPFKAREFDDMLCGLLPWWVPVARMFRPSVSAFVSGPDGQLTGAGSLRCYAFVDKAAAIPAVGLAITDALWRAGKGRIEFSAAGSMLLRCPVDTSVWQPERLDFAGPAVLGDGLTQRKFPPLIYDGWAINACTAIAHGPGNVSIAEWASKSPDVAKARTLARPEETTRRASYVEKRVATAQDPETAKRRYYAALGLGKLDRSTPINFLDGRTATVEQVLANPASFDRLRCADPEDPEYAHDRRIAVLYANGGWPRIFSHAHGGTTYKLGRAQA